MEQSPEINSDGDLEARHNQPIQGESRDVDLTEAAAGTPVRKASRHSAFLEEQLSQAELQSLSQPSHFSRDEQLTEVAGDQPYSCPPRQDRGLGSECMETGLADDRKTGGADLQAVNQVDGKAQRSAFATRLYVHGYLIFFSILGVLARLGVEAITFYPGAPSISPVLWANFGGSLLFGFLLEDQRLFREEARVAEGSSSEESGQLSPEPENAPAMTKKRHLEIKKTMPLYIGLSTGFCGSFTSFSSFILDAFLALANSLRSPDTPPTMSIPQRHNGYSVNAALAIFILHITVSLSALLFGAHIALALERLIPSLPSRFCRRFLDPLTALLGIGCWIGAILLAVFPPKDVWRGRAVFSCVLGPIGCLARYHISRQMNARIPRFPMGTFTVNVFGTVILGMCYDLQHSVEVAAIGGRYASVIGCQVLEGVMQGFCGALTTVSTWVGELNGLRRIHAYIYGTVSVAVSFCLLIAIMGGVRWSQGFEKITCDI